MKPYKMSVLLVATAMLASVGMANAAGNGRIIPEGSVTFMKNGEPVAKYNGQAPLDESAMITCDGKCLVKLTGISLVATDKAVFAVRQNDGVVGLYLKSGQVDFSVLDVTSQMAFYTPDGRYVMSEGFIAPASSTSSVEGYMGVDDTAAEIGVRQGSMVLATAEGFQTIDPGYAYKVAFVEGGAGAGGTGGAGLATGGTLSGGVLAGGIVGLIALGEVLNAASPNL